MEITAQPIAREKQRKLSAAKPGKYFLALKKKGRFLLHHVKSLGLTETMEEYDQRKLGIFNKLNFFQEDLTQIKKDSV